MSILNDDRTDDVAASQLRATFNAECGRFFMEKSDFKQAYSRAMAAVICLREEHPLNLVVDAFRVASRACVMRRRFDVAKVGRH